MELALAFEDSQPFRLTVDQYRALDEAGAFEDNPRIELIEGMIVCMNSRSLPHVLLSNELGYRFREVLTAMGSPYRAFIRPTVAMPPHNAPDPDIAITTVPPNAHFPSRGSGRVAGGGVPHDASP